MGCSSWSTWSLRVLFLACLVLLSSAVLTAPPWSGGGSGSPAEVAADEALLTRMCDRRPPGVPRSWCHELHYLRRRGGPGGVRHNRRHHHHHHHHNRPVPVPLLPPPAPGRDGGGDEEIDPRYGVAKRLVPTGPNPLHN